MNKTLLVLFLIGISSCTATVYDYEDLKAGPICFTPFGLQDEQGVKDLQGAKSLSQSEINEHWYKVQLVQKRPKISKPSYTNKPSGLKGILKKKRPSILRKPKAKNVKFKGI